MHPPAWICRKLFRDHPDLRLAWHGKDKQHPDEMNAGAFALVELVPNSKVGPKSAPWTYRELWDVSPRITDGGNVEMVKRERGPIFNRNGGTTYDWDPLTHTPIYVINLEGFGYSKEQVCDGYWIRFLDRWRTSLKQRFKDSNAEAYKKHKSDTEAVTNEASKFLWREAQKADSTRPIVPYEDQRVALKELDKKREKQEQALKGHYFQ